jgi:hypothetical protein
MYVQKLVHELLNKIYIKNYFFTEVKKLFIIRGDPYLDYDRKLSGHN